MIAAYIWVLLPADTTIVHYPQTVYEPELQLHGGQGKNKGIFNCILWRAVFKNF